MSHYTYQPYPSYPSDERGFVYVLTNPAMPGVVKIGATRKHPIQRTQELSRSTGVPEPYHLIYHQQFARAFRAEDIIHDHFHKSRTNQNREFFAIDPNEVIAYLVQLKSDPRVSYNVIKKDDCPTPFSELFAAFPDDGSPRELTSEELAKCDALRRRTLVKASYLAD